MLPTSLARITEAVQSLRPPRSDRRTRVQEIGKLPYCRSSSVRTLSATPFTTSARPKGHACGLG